MQHLLMGINDTIVGEGDWLGVWTKIDNENNHAVVYVGNSHTKLEHKNKEICWIFKPVIFANNDDMMT